MPTIPALLNPWQVQIAATFLIPVFDKHRHPPVAQPGEATELEGCVPAVFVAALLAVEEAELNGGRQGYVGLAWLLILVLELGSLSSGLAIIRQPASLYSIAAPRQTQRDPGRIEMKRSIGLSRSSSLAPRSKPHFKPWRAVAVQYVLCVLQHQVSRLQGWTGGSGRYSSRCRMHCRGGSSP